MVKRRQKVIAILLAVMTLGTVCPLPLRAASTILRVQRTATGAVQDGTSWPTAFTTLQAALARAASGDEIWVAADTYAPTADSSRGASFTLIDGVALYGGFAGFETTRNQRDWKLNQTILSGDIGIAGTDPDNSYHVVMSAGVTAILDGVVITGGNADATISPHDRGGGLLLQNGSLSLRNITLVGNHARLGGAVYTEQATAALYNLVVAGNTATNGGAIYNQSTNPQIVNTTFTANSADSGSAIFSDGASTPLVQNSIFWGNGVSPIQGSATIAYSIVQGGYSGVNNRDVDPLFAYPAGSDAVVGTLDDDVHLSFRSPAIDAGDTAALSRDVTTDRDGAARSIDDPDVPDMGSGAIPRADLGAYEYLPTLPSGAPTDLVAAPISRSRITLTWVDHSINEAGFRIERSQDGGAEWQYIGLVPSNITTYTDVERTCNTEYLYRVRSVNGVGMSAPSNTASATIADCTLDPPANLVAEPMSPLELVLRWADNSENESGFVLERSPDGTIGWVEIERVPADQIMATSRGLACNTTYFYRVRAFHLGGASSYSNLASATTLACVPQRIYVNRSSPGANDGQAWSSAYTNLQDGLTAAMPGDEIWAAKGVYTPGGRGTTFRLTDGVAVYGGFSGLETARDQRDWQQNVTMLSSDGAEQIVSIEGVGPTTLLDG